MPEAPWQFFIDVGGTFTDVVARPPGGGARTFKLLSTGDNLAHDLMAGNDRRLANTQLTFDDVQISSTDATRTDFDEQLALTWLRYIHIRVFQRTITHQSGSMQQASFHANHPNPSRVSRSNRLIGSCLSDEILVSMVLWTA